VIFVPLKPLNFFTEYTCKYYRSPRPILRGRRRDFCAISRETSRLELETSELNGTKSPSRTDKLIINEKESKHITNTVFVHRIEYAIDLVIGCDYA
jgi:hypothetical protein